LSVLTKVFVVMVAICSVILVSVTVTFVANVENWRQSYQQVDGELKLAKARAQTAQAEVQAHLNQTSEQFVLLKNETAKLRSELEQALRQNAEYESTLTSMEAENSRLNASVTHLTAASKTLSDISDRQGSELGNIRDSFDIAKTNLIQTADLYSESATRVEILERDLRHKQEQLAALVQENEQLASVLQKHNITADAPSEVPAFEPDFAISGTVTQVRQSDDKQDTFVQIDVGQNDGVEENMKFMVHRDAQFLGTLQVNLVDARASSGRITLDTGEQILAGDQILSGPER